MYRATVSRSHRLGEVLEIHIFDEEEHEHLEFDIYAAKDELLGRVTVKIEFINDDLERIF